MNSRGINLKNQCNCVGESTETQSCGSRPTQSPTETPTEAITIPSDDSTSDGDSSDDCLSVTTTWTNKLCRQPFDAILQYAMGEFFYF